MNEVLSKRFKFINYIIHISSSKILNFFKNIVNLSLNVKNKIYVFYNKYQECFLIFITHDCLQMLIIEINSPLIKK